MKLSKPLMSFVASLCIILLLVLVVNLGNSSSANASRQDQGSSEPVINSVQPQEDEGTDEEEDEEERDNEEGDQEDEDEDDEDQEEDEDDDDEEDEGDEEDWEFEVEIRNLEVEKAAIESNIGRLEIIERMTKIAGNDEMLAGYAILHMQEFMEIDSMKEILEEVSESDNTSASIKNLAKLKLAEVYAEEDRQDDVKRIFKSLLKIK